MDGTEFHCGCWACHDIAGKVDLPCGVHCVQAWEVSVVTTVHASSAGDAMRMVDEQMPWPGHTYVLSARKVKE